MKRMMFGSSSGVMLVLVLAAAASAATPKRMHVGGERLTLAGHGTRSELLFIELYRVALYLPHDMSEPSAIQSRDVPKALRVEVRYDGSLPDRIPAGWRSELMPVLTGEQQQALLLQDYQRLEQGDTVTISYAPGSGTTVSVNDAQILHDKGHETMNAFLDVWIGRQPVSQDLKQALL